MRLLPKATRNPKPEEPLGRRHHYPSPRRTVPVQGLSKTQRIQVPNSLVPLKGDIKGYIGMAIGIYIYIYVYMYRVWGLGSKYPIIRYLGLGQ